MYLQEIRLQVLNGIQVAQAWRNGAFYEYNSRCSFK